MRAVVIDGPGSIRVDTRPDPVLPGPDGAIIAVTAAGICGSDLHFYDGEYPLAEPVALGHEDGIHQGVGEDFGMGFGADAGQQFLAVGGGGAGAQDKGTHGAFPENTGRKQGVARCAA